MKKLAIFFLLVIVATIIFISCSSESNVPTGDEIEYEVGIHFTTVLDDTVAVGDIMSTYYFSPDVIEDGGNLAGQTFRWDFNGDGYWDTKFESYVDPVEWQFATADTFLVTVEFALAGDVFATASQEVVVDEFNIESVTLSVNPPSASFIETFMFSAVVGGLDESENETNLQYRWDFNGDGNWDTGDDWISETDLGVEDNYYQVENVSVNISPWQYSLEGDYEYTVEIKEIREDREVIIGKFSDSITVNSMTDITIIANPTSAPIIDLFTFNASLTNADDGDVIEYRWDFDNNGEWDTDWLGEKLDNKTKYASISEDATWKYNETGIYTARVEAKEVRTDGSVPPTVTSTQAVTVTSIDPIFTPVSGTQSKTLIETFEFSAAYEDVDPNLVLKFKWDFDSDGIPDTDWISEETEGTPCPDCEVSIVAPYNLTNTVSWKYETTGPKMATVKICEERDNGDVIYLGPYTIDVTVTDIVPANSLINTVMTLFEPFVFRTQINNVESDVVLQYIWDFDGDGEFDTGWLSEILQYDNVGNLLENFTSIDSVVYNYESEGDYTPNLQIREVRTEKYIDLGIHSFPTFTVEPPENDDPIISMEIILPSITSVDTFKVGDIVEFEVEILYNHTLFKTLRAYAPGYESFFDETISTPEDTLRFQMATVDFPVGTHQIMFELTDIGNNVISRSIDIALKEDIPTFDIKDDGGVGYELKSIVQTYDGGYITVASDPILGTRVVKYMYNKTTKVVDVLWTSDDIDPIPANVGIGESICEDREYDGGVVIAGWRENGTDKDTWIRKVSSKDGSLIWNKHFGYPGIDDGATVIKKSIDDGYIIGGYTKDYYRFLDGDSLTTFILDSGHPNTAGQWPVYNWDTGYDVRLLKVYSNGNENWGHHIVYDEHTLWRDITGHTLYKPEATSPSFWWLRTMGDQYITDLVIKDDGNYMVTGWNNSRLYDGSLDKDMFFSEFNYIGGLISTTTWSKMSAFDIDHLPKTDDFADDYDIPNFENRLNETLLTANHLGTPNEDEIGYGLTDSHGGYAGNAVMVGETYEIDDQPAKSKFLDAWVVEFAISADDDGALWEYTFGDKDRNEKAFGIDQTKDDGYIVAGYHDEDDNTSGTETEKSTWIYKLNTQLYRVWEKTYDSGVNDFGVKAIQDRDGGFIIGGNVGTGASVQARLIKVNKLGEFNL
ncbi:MAG: hypothetical protein PF638_00245 [Candidatus Delongbacteria bacterium]|jgi:hypothetical protein|nr:hypothetical protein [Candidatus Delongbacteria bacterium]